MPFCAQAKCALCLGRTRKKSNDSSQFDGILGSWNRKCSYLLFGKSLSVRLVELIREWVVRLCVCGEHVCLCRYLFCVEREKKGFDTFERELSHSYAGHLNLACTATVDTPAINTDHISILSEWPFIRQSSMLEFISQSDCVYYDIWYCEWVWSAFGSERQLLKFCGLGSAIVIGQTK